MNILRNDMKPITVTFAVKERELYDYMKNFNSPSSHIKDLIQKEINSLEKENYTSPKAEYQPTNFGLFE